MVLVLAWALVELVIVARAARNVNSGKVSCANGVTIHEKKKYNKGLMLEFYGVTIT